MFDPNSFLEATLDSNSTELKPVPQGEFLATVKEIKTNSGTKGDRAWASLDVTWTIEDPTIQEELHRTPTVRQKLFLDLDENGQLDMAEGRNVNLGRFRAALDVNAAGTTIGQAVGRQARVRVTHRIWEGKPQPEVSAVTKIA